MPGRAVIHMGKHLHRVDKIISGERQNIVVFMRSKIWRGNQKEKLFFEDCPSWCWYGRDHKIIEDRHRYKDNYLIKDKERHI